MIFSGGKLRRTIASNTTSQLIGRAASTIAGVAISFYLASTLGSEGYGDFIKITTVISLFYLFADFGLNAVYIQQKQKVSHAWQHLLGARLSIALLLMIILVCITYILPGTPSDGYTPTVKWLIRIFSPLIIAHAIVTSANAYFQQSLSYHKSALSQFIASTPIILCILTLYALHISASLVIGLLLVTSMVSLHALSSLLFIHRDGQRVTPIFSARANTQLLVSAVPLAITLATNMLFVRADSFILAVTRSTQDVGLYGLAYKLFELALIVPTFFMNSVYPVLVSASNDGHFTRPLIRIALKALMLLLLLSIATTILYLVFAPFVILVKSDFAGSVGPLRILSIGIPLFYASSLTMWLLITLKMKRQLMYIYATALVVNVVLNFIFIPAHGIYAAAWTTNVSEFVVFALSSLALLHRLRYKNDQ